RIAQGTEWAVCAGQSAEGDRLCVPRRPSHGDDREGHHEELLRKVRHARVLELLLQRRTSGTDRGPTISARFRWHYRQRSMGRSDRIHDWSDVESEGALGGAGHGFEDGSGSG